MQKICQNTIFGSSRISFHFFDFKNSVKTQFLGVVEFPSIFLISKIQGSGFSFQFLKNYHNLQFFRVILNFAQECYYLKNKVGVVDFANAQITLKNCQIMVVFQKLEGKTTTLNF